MVSKVLNLASNKMYQTHIIFIFAFGFALNAANAYFFEEPFHRFYSEQCDPTLFRVITSINETWTLHIKDCEVNVIADSKNSKGRATGGPLGSQAFTFAHNAYQLVRKECRDYLLCISHLFNTNYDGITFARRASNGIAKVHMLIPILECETNPKFEDFLSIIRNNTKPGGCSVPFKSGPSFFWMLGCFSRKTPYVFYKSCSEDGCATVIEWIAPSINAISATQVRSAFSTPHYIDYSELFRNEKRSSPQRGYGIITSFDQ